MWDQRCNKRYGVSKADATTFAIGTSRFCLIFVAMASIALTSCTPILSRVLQPPGRTIVVPEYQLTPINWVPRHAVAGAAKVDITPPAGFPTGGHGPAGAMSRGYSSRLYARAFFFADSAGSPLVLVSCDFFAVPGGLTAMVGRRVSQKELERGVLIPPEAIIISATHTHQGPGNFLTSVSYNQFGSKYPGFDERLLNFLADRIVEAVDSAVADGMRAGEVKLSIRHSTVTAGLLMNRSPATFLSNWNAQRIMDALNRPTASCVPTVETGEAREKNWDARGCPRLRAVDRNMTLLEITRGTDQVGLLLFLAVHPTVLLNSAPFFSSDFVGQTLAQIENESATHQSRPQVAGFFNGAEGDVVPRRSGRDLRDVERLADTLLTNIKIVLETPGDDLRVTRIVARSTMLRPGRSYGSASWGRIGLPSSPLMGAAGLGGPENDRTVLYEFGWHEGISEVPGEGQGGKLGALDSQLLPIRLTHLLAPDYAFPRDLPIHYAEIGALKLVSMPGELSTASGRMLRDALGDDGRFEIIGLANEYTSYVATPDEYEVHDYMGASTLWGPNEARVFIWAAVCLSGRAPVATSCAALPRPNPLSIGERRFSPGKTPGKIRGQDIPFGPKAVGERLNEADDGLQDVLRDSTGAAERNLPRFEWVERIRNDREEFGAAAGRYVRVLVREGNAWVPRHRANTRVIDDDLGPNFLTLMREAPPGGKTSREERRWVAIWLAPILERSSLGGNYRFEVMSKRRDGSMVRQFLSCPFVVNLTPTQRAPTIGDDANGCSH